VWRGEQEIEAREWQRDKARQLIQLLLTRRGRWLQREEICELLWPQLSPEAAGRDFKVALNALYRALEPARAPEAPSAFVARDGSAYRLRPEVDLWHDAAAFVELCAAGLAHLDAGDQAGGAARLGEAIACYTGDYLPEALYDDWAAAERERLRARFLSAAERLAAALLELGRPVEAAEVCARIIAQERCHERAYRLLMLAHASQGNRPLSMRAYQRCVEALQAELSLNPAPATADLHERIRRGVPLPPVADL
jgi:DNA-binding SARP family transcriptional activator